MGLDYWDLLWELLPSLPLYLGVLVGAVVVQAAVRLYQRTVMRHGTALVRCGLTGELVARRLLAVCGLDGVRLVCQGLRDLYHPWKREIRLSTSTFNSPSLGALATAAHEVGHAQQFAEGIFLCRLRQFVWPLCWVLTGTAILCPMLSFLGASFLTFDQTSSVLLAVAVVTLALQLPILLPLERDASRRAKRLAQESGLLSPNEEPGFEALLRSAWLTYAAVEVQRWLLVLAAGLFLCYSPSLMGLDDEPVADPFSILSVHVADGTQVQPPASKDQVIPAWQPPGPPGYDWDWDKADLDKAAAQRAAALEALDQLPMSYLEAVLPNVIILGVLLVAFWLLGRFLNPSSANRSSEAMAIERSNAGLALCEQGKHEQAMEEFNQALKLAPMLAAALFNRGHTLLMMGRLDEAMTDLDAALRVEPAFVQAMVARGDVWQKRGDSGRALAEYDAAYRLAPQNPLALCCRGYTYVKLQEYELALADFEQALQLNPQDSWCYTGRGMIWLIQGDADRALADCDRAISLGAADAMPFAIRGRAWLAKNDHARAIEEFTQALRRAPNDASVLRDRGLVHHLGNAFDLAVKDLAESIRLDPADSVAWNNYGAALQGAGEYARAGEALRESIRLNPSFANPYKHLASMQATCPDAKFRDGAQAVANATRALELTEWKQVEWLSVLAAAYEEAGDQTEAEKWRARYAASQAERAGTTA